MTLINRLLATVKILLDSSEFLTRGFWRWFFRLILFNTIISSQNFLTLTVAENQTGPIIFRVQGHVLLISKCFAAETKDSHGNFTRSWGHQTSASSWWSCGKTGKQVTTPSYHEQDTKEFKSLPLLPSPRTTWQFADHAVAAGPCNTFRICHHLKWMLRTI